MQKSVRFGAPNLMFFLEDKSGGISPVIDDSNVLINPRFWATATTLIVGVLHRDDGDTDLTVSTSEKDAPKTLPRFECHLRTPSRWLQFSTSERELVMECDVAAHRTRVRVWSNDPQYPDRVLVLLD